MKRTSLFSLIMVISFVAVFGLPGCDELITEQIETTIAGNPTAEFSVDKDSGCVPLTVKFTDISNGPRHLWTWDFGDSTTSNDTNPTHTYNSAGTYTVSLKIEDTTLNGSDTEIKNRFVIVGQSIAGFTSSDSSVCAGTDITFTPVKFGGISSWSWNFGDGTPVSTDSVPTHTYSTPGLFDVTLTVNGACGQTVLTDTGMIQIDDCPTVSFFADTTIGCIPLIVTFFDSSVAGSSQAITSRLWDFGNGLTDSAQNPSVQYDTPGKYTVTLTINSTAGSSTDSISEYITVHDVTKALFSAVSPMTACKVDAQQYVVKFQDSSTGGITDWSWDFGDGTISNDTNPAHAFLTPGRYTITLQVTGPCGTDTGSFQNYITLFDSLAAVNFSKSADTILLADSVQLTHIDSLLQLSGRQWDFGDSTQSSSLSPYHKYAAIGTYEVVLTIWNDCDSIFALDTVVVIP